MNNAVTPAVSLHKEVPGIGGWVGEERQVACVILSQTLGGKWLGAHSASSLPYQGSSAGATIPLKLVHRCLATSCVVVSLPPDGGGLSGCLCVS